MTQTIRISLPGYDALTDTNLDHFALFADQDNVLIKEFTRGSASVSGSGGTQMITHSLGYVPFFLVYVNTDEVSQSNVWELVPNLQHGSTAGSVAPYSATSNISTLTITNNEGTARTFKWFIFYDNIVGSSLNTITESSQVVKVARSGVDATTSTNPNDYIFHSDLNTFKILKEGNVTISYTADGDYSFAHGAPITSPTSYLAFMQFPDGKTALLPGKGTVFSYDSNWNVSHTWINATTIGLTIAGTHSATSLKVKYYVFETPLP